MRCAFLAILGGGGVFYYFTYTPSQEIVSQSFWVPDGAEIYSSQEVEPGTFKIKKGFEEFQATTQLGQRVLVVYREGPFVTNGVSLGNGVNVEYFRAGQDGIFDYTSIFTPEPTDHNPFTIWAVQVDKKEAVIQYTAEKGLLAITLSFLFGLLGAMMTVVFVKGWKLIPQRR